jgi:hypothetical protein
MKRLSLLLAALILSACQTPAPTPETAIRSKIVRAPIKMPAGVDYGRLQLVDEARLIRVYTEMRGIGEGADNKLLFPHAMAEKINLTNRQVNRRFMDMILASRRFQVFDDSTTVVRENALQTLDGKSMDIIINGLMVGANQDIIEIQPYRKARTSTRLSVQMLDVLSGEQLFPAGVSVVGEWGMTQGEGTLMTPGVQLTSAETQLSLANDYQHALDKALEQAVTRIGKVLRPMGRVTFADATTVGIVGGSRHGFQGGDRLVVFHADTTQIGQRTVIARTIPLAVIRCDGVGTETSQCDIIQIDPAARPVAVGDFAVLSDSSATGVREE